MRPWKLSEVKYSYVKENPYQVAILPLGATEPHNLHLPYGTDVFQVEMICDRICEKAHAQGAKVALLPALPFGVESNLMEFPMPISLNPSTLDLVIQDILESLETSGIRKVIIMNGHGGNSLKHTLREIYGKTSVFTCLVNWYDVRRISIRIPLRTRAIMPEKWKPAWDCISSSSGLIFCDDSNREITL